MSNLSIKEVPEAWAEALRRRAARNHRSLQGELMAILERAIHEQGASASPAQGPQLGGQTPGHVIDRQGRAGLRCGWKTIEQIAEEHRKLFPQPVRGGPLAVDIIREDRDAR